MRLGIVLLWIIKMQRLIASKSQVCNLLGPECKFVDPPRVGASGELLAWATWFFAPPPRTFVRALRASPLVLRAYWRPRDKQYVLLRLP